MTNGQLAIRCRDLVKTYRGKPPVEAVRGLDLEVPVGECFGLLGPNGAGKTTTIEILEGLLPPTSGDVEILGRHWGRGGDHDIRQQLGVSLQETKLSEKMTVGETVALFRSFFRHGMSAEQAIARVSLEEKANARVGKLSGGQKQRLAVACAIVGDPKLLFLDEPTTGLDPQSRRQLWELIRSFKAEGRTIVLTTHYMDEAEKLCDRISIVDHGKIIAEGSPKQLIASLGGEHVIEFSLLEERPGFDVLAMLADFEGAENPKKEGIHYMVSVAEPHRAMPTLLQRLDETQLPLASLTTRHVSLEDVFVHLTGRRLRDEESNS
jgi:ABC-2 type transport system ATP-binding protein